MATSREDQKKDLISAGAGLAEDIAIETHGQLGSYEPGSGVQARSYWGSVWKRFKKDRLAVASGVFIVLFIITALVGGPIAQYFLGHGPNDLLLPGAVQNFVPVGPMTRVPTGVGHQTTLLVLGADSSLGRDEFLRLLYGARVSFEVALGATFLSVTVGVLLGAMAGYFGGAMDTIVSRLTEVVMAFPVLLFVIALSGTVGDQLDGITLGFLDPGVMTLTLILGAFGWFYPARIIRGLVLSLREKEFIEAARMTGASDWRIIRSHLMPHVVAPVIVYSTLIIAVNVLAEAGLSFLGLGIKLPTPSWGNLLSSAPDYYTQQPWLMVWPGLAVLLTVLGFNLLGDGLRDAFDPRSTR